MLTVDRDQYADVAYLAGPTSLEHDTVEIDVGKFLSNLAIAPDIDVPVDLLVQP